MTLTLDAQTETRIQREIDNGFYADPIEVIRAALDLLDADKIWTADDKADLDRRLALSMEQAQRGEVYTAEQVARILDQRIANRGR